MSEIIQGDSGTVMQATISDSDGVVNLTSANSVEFTVKSPTRKFTKVGSFVDRDLGIVEFTLDSDDTQDLGNHVFQATIKFVNEKQFSSGLGKFKIAAKL